MAISMGAIKKVEQELERRRLAQAAAKKKADIGRQDLLRTEITEDKSISDITRTELLGGLGERGSLLTSGVESGFRSTFATAREGKEAKFKQRQKSQARTDILRDRPGRSQTILTR